MWISLVWFSMWRSTGARRCCWALPAPTLHRFWLPPACTRSAADWLTGWAPRGPRAGGGGGGGARRERCANQPVAAARHRSAAAQAGAAGWQRGQRALGKPFRRLGPAVAATAVGQPAAAGGAADPQTAP